MATGLIVAVGVILCVFCHLYRRFFPASNINPNGKYVLISGCDTGFGHALAIELDRRGFNILAGVFVGDNLISLKTKLSPKATVFRLDVTKQEDIDAVFESVREKTKVLHALVNNAGIGGLGRIDLTSMEQLRKMMDTNFFAQVAMTKKFLPLLIAKRSSRVVNLCSIGGFLASANMFAYCASKYALESFSDCLRREMFPWDLRVSIIEPGLMRTPIIQGLVQPFPDFWNSLATDVQERWGEEFLKSQHGALTRSPLLKNAEDPMKVVRVLEHAVMSSAPHIRYRPGYQSSLIFFPLSMLPTEFADWFFRKLNKTTSLPASVYTQLQD